MAGRGRRDLAIAIPAIGAQAAIAAGLFVAPVVVTVLTTRAGYDEAGAGALLSLESTSAALAMLGLSSVLRGAMARNAALIGLALVVAGNVLSLVSSAATVLAVGRFLAGVGCGAIGAGVAVIAVRARNPERIFSFQTIAAIIAGSIWIAVIPMLTESLGYRAIYAALLLALLPAGLVLRLPAPDARAPERATTQGAALTSFAGSLGLAAIFATQLGQGAFWAFVGRYGLDAGLSEQQVGAFLSVATLLLLVGVTGAAVIGARFGRIGPLMALVAVNAISIFVIATAHHPFTYVAANVLQAATNLSSVVFELGLMAAMDRTGRLAAAAGGLITLGNGMGPSIGGALATWTTVSAIGAFALAANLFALVAFAAVGASRSRGEKRQWRHA